MPGPRKSASLSPQVETVNVEIDAGAGVGDLPGPEGEQSPEETEEAWVDPDIQHELRSVMYAPDAPLTFKEANRRVCANMNELHGIDEFTFVKHYQSHVETFQHWILIISRGVSGKTKVLLYNLQLLVRFGGLATAHLDGTLMTMDKSSVLFIGFLMLAYTFVFVMTISLLDEGRTIETQSLENMTSSMNQVVPFVMGLYIALALQRWWALRVQGVGQIFNSIVDICMVVACVMHPERHKPIRTLIMKWSFASIFMLLKAVRNNDGMNDMLYKGLLSAEEIRVLDQVKDLHARPNVLWGWVLRLVHESFTEAVGPMPYSIQTAKVAEICMGASNGLSIIDMYLRTALPFVYVHLITLLVDINTLFFVTKTAVVSAVAYKEQDWQRIACELLCCILVPTLYRGLLSVSYAIFDPFGEDVLDFPVGSLMDWNASCCNAVLRAQETFPGVPDSVYAAGRASIVPKGRPSEVNPERFESIKTKCRRIILHCHRTGKLEMYVHKALAKRQSEIEAEKKNIPKISNAKSSAAMLSASAAAEPLAEELRVFGKSIRGQLIRLRHQVHELTLAVNEDGVRHHDDFLKALEGVSSLVQAQSQEFQAHSTAMSVFSAATQ